MKNNKVILAAIPSLIAAAALVLSFRSRIDADSLVGYGAVMVLIGLVAMEYRISWKRVLGRN